MKRVHLGHHFYGAGNLGDDFMLAGFLAEVRRWDRPFRFTCCVPHPLAPLARRFPEIEWLPYEEAARRRSIEACDVWLGLGGSPWQVTVSPWFADHLDGEARECQAAGKPMYFLGVGGQDPAAYDHPALRRVALQAQRIWTRDRRSAAALDGLLPPGWVREAADLAHLFFADEPPRAGERRAAVVLNFDYRDWPGLTGALEAVRRLPAEDRVWVAQESRPLPGAEIDLYHRLPAALRGDWRLVVPDLRPDEPLQAAFARWPAAEWSLVSRFHATLAAAWSGSRAVVVATNDKLAGAAEECGYAAVRTDASAAQVEAAFAAAEPPARSRLEARAATARRACREFFEATAG